MESLQQRENTVETKRLKRKFTGALLALLITFLAVASATYAWYIYNTSQHTTNVRMAAGAGVNLQISNAYNGVYGSSAVLESFSGQLVPVSTNKISAGFQKVTDIASAVMTAGRALALLIDRFGIQLILCIKMIIIIQVCF
mgnify:CR=1 FL=1